MVVVPAENVFPKPTHLTWEEAAAIPLAGLTAYRALVTRGRLQKGEVVVIPGIGGGVATFLLLIASSLGARVFVTSSSDEKLNRAMELGPPGASTPTVKIEGTCKRPSAAEQISVWIASAGRSFRNWSA